jgi:hypothetical protein
MIRLIKLVEDNRLSQIRRRKWRMINESDSQMEISLTPEEFHQLDDIISQVGGDLDPFIASDTDGINEADDDLSGKLNYEKMPIKSLEKHIQSKFDLDVKKDIVKKVIDKHGSVKFKQLVNTKAKDMTPEEKQEYGKLYSDFIKKYESEIEQEFVNAKRNKKISIKIDKRVVEETKSFISDMEEYKDWYLNINKKIINEFGDSDGTLFLILLAISSPRNKLQDNLRIASKIYAAIKVDEKNKISRAALDKILNGKSQESLSKTFSRARKESAKEVAKSEGQSDVLKVLNKPMADLNNEETKIYLDFMNTYGNKVYLKTKETLSSVDEDIVHSRLFDVLSQPGMGMVSTYMANLIRVLKDYTSNGFTFSRQEVVTKLRQFWTPSGTLQKQKTPISAEKVFSFTLNLLDPTYETLQEWNPVTIDTWMLLYFYPHLLKKERESLLQKAGTYTLISRRIQELSKKLGLKPLELQAMIWVAIIRKETKDPNYAVRYEETLHNEAEKAEIMAQDLEDIEKFFDEASETIKEYETKFSVMKIGLGKSKYID